MSLILCMSLSPTQDIVLRTFAASGLRAKIEVQSRLAKLYPEYVVAHMPADVMQQHAMQLEVAGPCVLPHDSAQATMGEREKGGGATSCPSGVAHSGCKGNAGCSTYMLSGCSKGPAGCSKGSTGCSTDASPGYDAPDAVASTSADCHNILANAAVHEDAFAWHLDADPWTLPESSWTEEHGHYFNRVGSGACAAVHPSPPQPVTIY